MAFSTEFTDAQGAHFPNAYFKVTSVTLNRGTTENGYPDPDTGALVVDTTATSNLNYQMAYWISEQHMLDGKPSYQLKTESGANFYASSLGADYDGLSAEACAELHCQLEVIS